MQSTKPTIIVCIDTSRSSDLPLLYACRLAQKSDFAVQILAVIESAKSLLFVSKAVVKDRRSEVEKQLRKLMKNINQETGIIPVISIREGEVASEIANEVKATPNCIMLVFGKSYNSQIDNNVLPKLSSQIGKKIKVPVMIVPDNLGEEYIKKLS